MSTQNAPETGDPDQDPSQPSAGSRSDVRILVGTDLSRRAARSHPLIVDLAKQLEGEVHLLHVFSPEPAPSVDVAEATLAEHDKSESLMEAESHLANDARLFEEEGVSCSWSIDLVGPIERALTQWARQEQASLIVLVTDESESLFDRLRGTVTSGVLSDAPCPVLTVTPGQAEKGMCWKRVIESVDFSQPCAEALAQGLPYMPPGTKVDLLYVVPETFPTYHGARGLESDFYDREQLEAGFESDTERFYELFGREDLEMEVHKLEGKKDELVLEAIERFGSDVLIVPVEKTGLFRDLGARLANRPCGFAVLSVPVA